MARTTSDLVKEICEVDDSIDLAAFIGVASMLVDDCCLYAADGVTPLGYSPEKLAEIERWLAAHFYSVRDKRTMGESVGSLQAQYETKVDMRLENTSYGQQALVLDVKGGLAALNNGLGKVTKLFPDATGRKPRITWLGTSD